MTDSALNLDERELVAIGASIGAGCNPCFNHHVKAATTAGVSSGRLRAALYTAGQVAAEARDEMERHIRTQLAFGDPTRASATPKDEALAALGAALGANDRPGIERHIAAAVAAGASQAQVAQAISVAEATQQSAGRLHHDAARRTLDRAFPDEARASLGEPSEEPCGCQAGAEATATA